MTTLCLIALLCYTAATSAAPTRARADTPKIGTLNQLARSIATVRDRKCLSPPRFRWHPGFEVPEHRRSYVIVQRRDRRAKNLALPSMCPADVIYRVFPAATEDEAYAVAYCETGGTLDPRARNRSGASGLFQLMPIHWRGKFDPFNALANARFAFRLSKGGTDWRAWVCQP